MEALSEIDKQASALLAELPELLKNGVEYGSDLFNRFWYYSIAIESFNVFISLTLSIICLLIIKKLWKYYSSLDECEKYDPDKIMPSLIIGVITLFFTPWIISNFSSNIKSLAKASFIPEVYIIEKFKNSN